MAGAAGASGYQVLVSGQRCVGTRMHMCVFKRVSDVRGCVHLITVTLNHQEAKLRTTGRCCVCACARARAGERASVLSVYSCSA